MNFVDLWIEVVKALWPFILIAAFGICMIAKLIYDEIEYRKWNK